MKKIFIAIILVLIIGNIVTLNSYQNEIFSVPILNLQESQDIQVRNIEQTNEINKNLIIDKSTNVFLMNQHNKLQPIYQKDIYEEFQCISRNINNGISNYAANNSCAATTLYMALKFAGANVEADFTEFFRDQIKLNYIREYDSWVSDRDEIVKEYTINGNPIRIIMVKDYLEFKNIAENGNGKHMGVVRIQLGPNNWNEHSLMLYGNGRALHQYDQGYSIYFGKAYNSEERPITRNNFQYYYWLVEA